jgi:hypothetical protein
VAPGRSAIVGLIVTHRPGPAAPVSTKQGMRLGQCRAESPIGMAYRLKIAAAVCVVSAVAAFSFSGSAVAREDSARIRVVAAGFSQTNAEEADFGVVLRNPTSLDARDVQVTTNLLSSSGRIVDTDSSTIALIPAGTTYYFGESTFPHGRVARLQTFTQVGEWTRHAFRLPAVEHVRITNDGFGPVVAGEIRNTLRGKISRLARISFVVFDSRGRVSSGGFTFPDSDIPRGRRIGFDSTLLSTAPARARSARASIENQGTSFNLIPG